MLMKIADMAELAYSITEGNKYFSLTSYLFIIIYMRLFSNLISTSCIIYYFMFGSCKS